MRTLFILFFLACQLRVVAQIKIEWTGGRAKSILVNMKGRGDRSGALSVFLEGQTLSILGRTEKQGDSIRFIPKWPFGEGKKFEVKAGDQLIDRFQIPENTGTSPDVTVFPSADTVPENLLKIYLAFSQPMEIGQSYENFYFIDSKNDTLRDALLQLQPELWNHDQTRLTVWLDPGRIKRDLLLNKKLGNPLQAGQLYKLVVGNTWKNSYGVPMKMSVEKFWHVTSADRTMPGEKRWFLNSPKAGTHESLVIQFDESLDYSLITETISIFKDDKRVDGKIAPGLYERKILFTPSSDWMPGRYTIQIEDRLEDLAGNNLNRLFDADLGEEPSALEKSQTFHESYFVIER